MSQTAPEILFDLNDMILQVKDLRNELVNPNNDPAGTFLNAATVTIEDILGETGVSISPPVSFPIPMVYVAASNGIYRATLEDSWGFLLGAIHKARVRADSGAGLRAEWLLEIESQVRES